MKCLFVNACIREESRTLELCRAYIEKNWGGQHVEEVNLKKERLHPLDAQTLNLRNEDIASGTLSAKGYDYARQFADAEEILIGAPFWDFNYPAILRVYLEQICVNGITFGYGDDGTPITFCKGKKLIYITTAGGYIPEMNSLEMYFKELCGMFGVPELKFIKADGLDIVGNDVDEILNSVKACL